MVNHPTRNPAPRYHSLSTGFTALARSHDLTALAVANGGQKERDKENQRCMNNNDVHISYLFDKCDCDKFVIVLCSFCL